MCLWCRLSFQRYVHNLGSYKFAHFQNETCGCANGYRGNLELTKEQDCDYICDGDNGLTCGGQNGQISVYHIGPGIGKKNKLYILYKREQRGLVNKVDEFTTSFRDEISQRSLVGSYSFRNGVYQ